MRPGPIARSRSRPRLRPSVRLLVRREAVTTGFGECAAHRGLATQKEQMMDKLVASAAAAVADIASGMARAVGGFGLCGIPSILIGALADAGPADLEIVSNNCGVDDWGLGLLLHRRRIRRIVASYVGGMPRCRSCPCSRHSGRPRSRGARWCRHGRRSTPAGKFHAGQLPAQAVGWSGKQHLPRLKLRTGLLLRRPVSRSGQSAASGTRARQRPGRVIGQGRSRSLAGRPPPFRHGLGDSRLLS
jgi:hypothetical protein